MCCYLNAWAILNILVAQQIAVLTSQCKDYHYDNQ